MWIFFHPVHATAETINAPPADRTLRHQARSINRLAHGLHLATAVWRVGGVSQSCVHVVQDSFKQQQQVADASILIKTHFDNLLGALQDGRRFIGLIYNKLSDN